MRKYVVLASALFLFGCGGTMTGVVRGTGAPVRIQYEQGMDRDIYTATIDGEHFKGNAVHADARSGFGTAYHNGASVNVFTTSSSGNIVAVLIGDRGSSMRCQMHYADSSGFTSMGGVGLCKLSDGRLIDVVW